MSEAEDRREIFAIQCEVRNLIDKYQDLSDRARKKLWKIKTEEVKLVLSLPKKAPYLFIPDGSIEELKDRAQKLSYYNGILLVYIKSQDL